MIMEEKKKSTHFTSVKYIGAYGWIVYIIYLLLTISILNIIALHINELHKSFSNKKINTRFCKNKILCCLNGYPTTERIKIHFSL